MTAIHIFPIGEKPFEKYSLSFQNGNDQLRNIWPEKIKGIDPEGTLFEKSSGKKLLYDADVEIEKEYYLLKRGDIDKHSRSSIRIQKITQKQFGRETWILYIVSASAFNEEAARFYLDFHCRLDRSTLFQCNQYGRYLPRVIISLSTAGIQSVYALSKVM